MPLCKVKSESGDVKTVYDFTDAYKPLIIII